MSLNQSIRYAEPNVGNINNPESLFPFVSPSRILVGTINPQPSDGQFFYYWINSTTGDLFFKGLDGAWVNIYNFDVSPGTGITNLINDGTGAQIFKSVIGTDAHIRTLLSADNKCVLLQEANDIAFSVQNLTPADVQLVKDNFNSTRDPINTDDSSQGYSIGSYWWNTVTAHFFLCRSNTLNAAAWILFSPAVGGPLTNCANVGFGGGIFANITGSTANFKSLTSTDASIIVSTTGTTVNLQALPPPGLYKDVFSGGFVDTVSTVITNPGTQYQVSQPWQLNASFSRGSWSIIGSNPLLSIQRTAPSVMGLANYLYNIELYLSYTTTGNFVGQSNVSFLLISNTGNCTFAPNFNNVTTSGFGPGAARLVATTMTTLMKVSDSNPASFYLAVYADTAQSLVNISTQVTIVQI